MLNLDSILELFPCHYLPGRLFWQGSLREKGNSYRWSVIKLDMKVKIELAPLRRKLICL